MTEDRLPDWVQVELTHTQDASARGLAALRHGMVATAARFDAVNRRIVVELANGAVFAFPPQLAQGLADASAEDLSDIELSPLGTGLHWSRLDTDLTVEGLLTGVFGNATWMRQHAARAGRSTSEAKAQAARANGAKGGRPRKNAA